MLHYLTGGGGPRHGREKRPPRVLIYSHDTFGLGHLRRSRAIANRLVQADPSASVVIISGSPIIGSFEFGDGVDYVRVPGVVKLPNGDYTTLSLNLPLDEAVAMREAIILQTARTLRPDLVIVDKEPTGFRGELIPALDELRAQGARIVLGIRDVMDDPAVLVPEWERKGAVDALIQYYNDIWVYGLREIYEPLAGLPLPEDMTRRIVYTGYLRREVPPPPNLVRYPRLTRGPFVLVTTGGGGDGHELIDWVLSAYEADPSIAMPALIVFGPFVARDRRGPFMERVARLPNVDAITFDAKIEHLMSKATSVISMGGYNTFCEILSLDKRALIVPRKSPRLEQSIRAEHAARLGLLRQLDGANLDPGAARDPMEMARAIHDLPTQPLPSRAFLPQLLDGLNQIERLTTAWFQAGERLAPIEVLGKVAGE
ncbi:glycosyltransferase family protein [Labrys wisconsinensis]|uniref:Glycosyltransferase n=1 Tax=Labrys wisconsinensis TaxID=425677 RepID=A0ABU0IYH4_9HYPH|nr:glycosyltransferase [Labrys wisconsinensis]MDQ0467051.1 putative glycosyltransferase [Labrys wisconsinensis]